MNEQVRSLKAHVICFTGTGNTLRVSKALLEAWRARGHEGEISLLHDGRADADLAGVDRLVIAYPVHGFNAPQAVLDYLSSLPEGEGRTVYLLRTSGEPLSLNDAAVLTPQRILKRRGYHVAGDFYYVMPYNIIFRHSDGMASRMWRAALTRFGEDAAAMEQGVGTLPRVGLWARTLSGICKIEHAAAPLIGRGFKVTEDCVGCGLCERRCPQGNIRMEKGTPKFGKNCAICMGCAFACPKDAIRTGILNGWRVNGAYDFEAVPARDDEVCSYCKNSYLNYYHAAESATGGTNG